MRLVGVPPLGKSRDGGERVARRLLARVAVGICRHLIDSLWRRDLGPSQLVLPSAPGPGPSSRGFVFVYRGRECKGGGEWAEYCLER